MAASAYQASMSKAALVMQKHKDCQNPYLLISSTTDLTAELPPLICLQILMHLNCSFTAPLVLQELSVLHSLSSD